MPLPEPKKGEDRNTFVSRCMADEAMQKEYGKGSKQCLAVCESQYDRHHKAEAGLTVRMAGDVAEVLLYGEIVRDDPFGRGISAREFRDQVKGIRAKVLNLRIDSPGGSIFEGAAMMAALTDFKGRVEVDIDGMAASMASYLAMAGHEVRINEFGYLMVHNPSAGVMGTAPELRRLADLLEVTREKFIDAYAQRTRASREQVGAWMDGETWFMGQQAVDAGFANRVTRGRLVAAHADFRGVAAKLGYRHVPTVLMFTHNSKTHDPEPEWGGVDKGELPMLAFADHGDGEHHSTFSYPHHWVSGCTSHDANGVCSDGTLYLHKGGLAAAWSAAHGGRSGQRASQAVIDHLAAHRAALGLDKEDAKALWDETDRRKAIAAKL